MVSRKGPEVHAKHAKFTQSTQSFRKARKVEFEKTKAAGEFLPLRPLRLNLCAFA
jgi:hypothetical protein